MSIDIQDKNGNRLFKWTGSEAQDKNGNRLLKWTGCNDPPKVAQVMRLMGSC